MANLARNDIQESLRDLGKNSVYSSGQRISPSIEDPNNPNCTPITGWRFTFGDGINGADTGDFGKLSKVSQPRRQFTTLASTPELNTAGNPNSKDILGAVTVTLDSTETTLASSGSLWVQGGAPGDPVNDSAFPGTYGFAALRCAIDNLNGDNVEFVRYPSGTVHVFCYAYYVTPPPTSGTIVIKKQVDVDAGQSYDQDFAFDSNITYNANNQFVLAVRGNAPATASFIRAETTPGVPLWQATELVPAGWQLQSVTCRSATGQSPTTASASTAKVTIDLAAGDTVTCTYTNERDAGGPLVVAKRTIGAVGPTRFRAGLVGTKLTKHTIRTTEPRVSATWTTPFTRAGRYQIGEKLPTSSSGRWHLLNVTCDGHRQPRRTVIRFTMPRASGGSLCTFTNVFVPRGSITVRGVTLGGTASISWLAEGPSFRPTQYAKGAVTTTPGEPVTATGDATDFLRFGTFAITQTGVVGDDRPWELIDIACSGGVVGTIAGGVTVRLSRANPHITCTFTNRAGARPPDPPDPPDPTPPDPPDPPIPPLPPDPPIPNPGPTPPAHEIVHQPRTLPAGAVETGFGPASSVPSVFRPGSPDADLLEAAGDARTVDPRVHRGARSAVDRMVIRVPRLGIRGRLQRLDLAAGHRLRVPADPARVGWWSGGARPGARGSTVLAGHVDGPAGPAVFNRLRFARRGDLITIRRPGHRALRYRVTGVHEYRKGRLPRRLVFGGSHASRLRLITCGGRFDTAAGHYADNIVVYARLV
jgi:hypothetical protein